MIGKMQLSLLSGMIGENDCYLVQKNSDGKIEIQVLDKKTKKKIIGKDGKELKIIV